MVQAPNSENDQEYLQVALQASDLAAAIQKHYFGKLKNVTEKFQAGLVSEADQECEVEIKTLLQSSFPAHAFLGEETGRSGSSEAPAVWMIDPLDGTTNFVHQFPVFCVSIGLQIDGKMRVAVIDAPMLGQRFWAIRGQGAFMNGARMHVSQRKEASEALLATGFSYTDNGIKEQLKLVELAVLNTRGLRRAGSAALDLAWVAQGVFDLFWERNLKPWDIAAGSLLVEEAGGKVSCLDGREFDPYQPHIIAGTPVLHDWFLSKSQQILSNPL